MSCQHRWSDDPGPSLTCPRCDEVYIRWTNFDAASKVLDLLERVREWLPTEAVRQRLVMSSSGVHDVLHSMLARGDVERREAPDNRRVAEWRVPPDELLTRRK